MLLVEQQKPYNYTIELRYDLGCKIYSTKFCIIRLDSRTTRISCFLLIFKILIDRTHALVQWVDSPSHEISELEKTFVPLIGALMK